MSFSARQLHCLDAMGLVAWTSKNPAVTVDNAVELQAPAVALKQQKTPLSTPIELAGSTMPSNIEQLGPWLVKQTVSSLTYKGSETYCIGSDQASLTVVCLQVDITGQLPLSRECAQLLDLMMRAIDTPRTGYRQCVISVGPITQTGPGSSAVYLDDILTPQTRAILVLDPHLDSLPETTDSDKSAIPQSSVPLWRVPHPDLLLSAPTLKRRAWQALKGLRQVLDVR